ncbi:MAG: fibronectin type III domain-containing protein [Akkermansiaceae bacterium]|nr:fibronectin type III domain-containing protein [Verrucomicrobiales bacterium]
MRRNFLTLMLGVGLLAIDSAQADYTWLYTVQVSAAVQSAPPRITLNWPVPPGSDAATSYTVYRKTRDETAWGSGTALPGSATNFTDTTVEVGVTYEYQVVKQTFLGYVGYGYIYTGIQAPLIDARGKLLLMVANTHAAALSNELARLQRDLVGDGWLVIRHDVAPNASPDAVRNLIIADYTADPTNVNTVFLLGHVPIFYSGTNLNYDGHLARAMPADAFYGDMNGDWSSRPGFLPSDVELMVGRVDLSDMPGIGAKVPWPSELELLRNYLNKDHAWRHKQINVQRRALMGDRRGIEDGEAVATSGYRVFEPFVGPGNTVLADTENTAQRTNRWISKLTAGNYLWAYGCGAGDYNGISYLGTNASDFYFCRSTEVVGRDAKAVFVMLFGSWFGNWDHTDDFMRSFLATPTMGLAACMAGRPHWFLHHMGLGETIGYGTRLTMNNSTLYRSNTNNLMRAIYIALMGDPTLRMEPVTPPGNLIATLSGTHVNLNWAASPDASAGYHVYRAGSPDGPFVRLTDAPTTNTTFADTNAGFVSHTYMVRAVKLETNPSGSYFNPSQGIFTTSTAPILVAVANETNGVTLTWNAQIGTAYRVLAKADFNESFWNDVSGTLTATGTNLSWIDTNSPAGSQRFYQIKSP